MRSYRWDGEALALSSITHIGETLGTIGYLRREAFLTPNGRVDVPVVSGNSVRGVLRDTGAHLLWDALDRPRLPLPVMHALWSGGALVKSRTQPLTGQRLADLRRMVAHIGVFGAAGGGRILDGSLTVGKLVPACAQIAHLLPDRFRDTNGGAGLPDLRDLLQIERYSRIPDDRAAVVVTGATASSTDVDSADPASGTGTDTDTDPSTDGLLMRYGVESFIPGTRFHSFFALTNATDTEYDFFADVLDTWLPNATVGGKTGRGHGRIQLTLDHTPAPERPGETGQWRSFGGAEPSEVVRALTWLD